MHSQVCHRLLLAWQLAAKAGHRPLRLERLTTPTMAEWEMAQCAFELEREVEGDVRRSAHRTVDLVEALSILADLVPPADVLQRRPVQMLRERKVKLRLSSSAK